MITPSNTGMQFARPRQCIRKSVITRTVKGEGELGFCKHHDPEAKAARDAAQSAKWKADIDARRAAWWRWADESRACEGMKDPVAAIAAAKAALEKVCHPPLSGSMTTDIESAGCAMCDCLKALQLLKGES